jgi:hypothetical protein
MYGDAHKIKRILFEYPHAKSGGLAGDLGANFLLIAHPAWQTWADMLSPGLRISLSMRYRQPASRQP